MSALALQRGWGFIVPAVCSARLPTTWSSISTPQAQPHVCGKRNSQQFGDVSAVSARQLRTNLFLSAKYANLTRALETYEEMKSRGYRLGREEVNTLLYVCQSCPDGGVDLTLRIYDELKDGFNADENTDVILVRCYADLGRIEDGLALIAERRASGQPPRLRNYSPILQRLWKDGDDVRAKHVWKEMLDADVMPNEEVIVGMLECYAARGREAFLGNAEDVEMLLDTLGRTVVNVTGSGLDAVEASFNFTAPWAVRRVSISAEAEGVEGDEGAQARDHTDVTSPALGAGVCPSCGGRLQRLSLTDEERKHFREGLLKLAGIKAATWAVYIKARAANRGEDAPVPSSSSRHTNTGSGVEKGSEASSDVTSSNGTAQLQAMEAWLAARPLFDFVIDAPNVAYYGQNFEQGRFSFRQVDMILSELRAQGKRAFITIPMKYTNRRIPNTVRHSSLPKSRSGVHRELEDSETDLLKRWMEEKIVFRVPRGQLDDLYWMYATVADSNSKPLTAISNDCMRDHWEDLLDQRTFMHWRTSQVMSYSFLHDNRSATSVTLKAAPFSREAQRTPETGCLHLPSDRSDDDWLCVDLQQFHNPACADAYERGSDRHEQGSNKQRERVRERRPTSGMGFGSGVRGRRKGSREEKGLQQNGSTTASRDEKKTPLTAHGLRPWESLQ